MAFKCGSFGAGLTTLVALGICACGGGLDRHDPLSRTRSEPGRRPRTTAHGGLAGGGRRSLSARARLLAKWDHDGDFSSSDGDKPNSFFDGDDRSVRYFGRPAGAAERRSIEALIAHYYAAAATHKGGAACQLVDPMLARALVEDPASVLGSSQPVTGGCATVLSRLFAHPPGRSTADLKSVKVIGVRVRGNTGLVLLRLPNSQARDMPVTREGRTWKLEAFFDNGLL